VATLPSISDTTPEVQNSTLREIDNLDQQLQVTIQGG